MWDSWFDDINMRGCESHELLASGNIEADIRGNISGMTWPSRSTTKIRGRMMKGSQLVSGGTAFLHTILSET